RARGRLPHRAGAAPGREDHGGPGLGPGMSVSTTQTQTAATLTADAPPLPAPSDRTGPLRIALLGNPNTGKTTLFNRLSGLRHKTGNFPGTTQEARVGNVPADGGGGAGAVQLVDLPGIYSLELDQTEAEICRRGAPGARAPPR